MADVIRRSFSNREGNNMELAQLAMAIGEHIVSRVRVLFTGGEFNPDRRTVVGPAVN